MTRLSILRLGAQVLASLCLLILVNILFYSIDGDFVAFRSRNNTYDTAINNNSFDKYLKDFSNSTKKGNEENKPMNKVRYLIYLCDKQRWCGGWGDRQRGIVATYVMATVIGRKFGLNMSYPCDIKLFYIPNKINWYVQFNEIRGLSWEIVDWIDNKHIIVDRERDFNERHPSDVVFLKTNLDLIYMLSTSPRYGHLVPSEYRKRTTAFSIGWHQLMKLSIHMEEHVDMFMSKIPTNGNLVCAHIRLRKSSTIPNDSTSINSISSLPSLWKFLSKYDKTASRLFIAADSVEARTSARMFFGEKELDTNGLVLHIDRQGHWNDACLGFEVALLDQIVLSRCKVLVMSQSGFSIHASMMSLIDQKLFLFRNGTITPTAQLSLVP